MGRRVRGAVGAGRPAGLRLVPVPSDPRRGVPELREPGEPGRVPRGLGPGRRARGLRRAAGRPAGRRAGRAAARGDAGRARGPRLGGVRRGRPGARRAPRGRLPRTSAAGATTPRRSSWALGPGGPTSGRHAARTDGESVSSLVARPGGRRGWTATTTPSARSPIRSAPWASARPSAARSPSTDVRGASWSPSSKADAPLPAGHRVADLRVHRARRHRDLERRGAVGPRRLARADRGGGRRRAPPRGARPARRRAAAPRPHRHHAEARAPGARAAATTRRSSSSPRRSSSAQATTAELRELAHGILPSVLTRGGLRAGVEALAVADAGAGRDRRRRGPAPGGRRGDRLLRRRGGADERRQARPGATPRSRRASRTTPSSSTSATTASAAPADGSGLVGLARPARRARRPAPRREPGRRRDGGRRRDPARILRLTTTRPRGWAARALMEEGSSSGARLPAGLPAPRLGHQVESKVPGRGTGGISRTVRKGERVSGGGAAGCDGDGQGGRLPADDRDTAAGRRSSPSCCLPSSGRGSRILGA